MKKLFIASTDDTPSITLDKDANLFEIDGRSFPENADKFFEPVISWLSEYAAQPNASTTFNLKINYFNTATSKHLYNLVFQLDKINTAGNPVEILWFYDDDDEYMLDVGEELADMVSVPFKFIPIEDS